MLALLMPIMLLLPACGDVLGSILGSGIRRGIDQNTGEASHPRLLLHDTDPRSGARDVEVHGVITLEFSQSPSRESVESVVRLKRESGEIVEVRFNVSGDLVTVTPMEPLEPGQAYVLVIGQVRPEAESGRKMKAGKKIRFHTAGARPLGLLRYADA